MRSVVSSATLSQQYSRMFAIGGRGVQVGGVGRGIVGRVVCFNRSSVVFSFYRTWRRERIGPETSPSLLHSVSFILRCVGVTESAHL